MYLMCIRRVNEPNIMQDWKDMSKEDKCPIYFKLLKFKLDVTLMAKQLRNIYNLWMDIKEQANTYFDQDWSLMNILAKTVLSLLCLAILNCHRMEASWNQTRTWMLSPFLQDERYLQFASGELCWACGDNLQGQNMSLLAHSWILVYGWNLAC